MTWSEIKLSFRVMITILVTMALFETLKQLVLPSVSIIESHIITILFTTFIGTIVSGLAMMEYKKMQDTLISTDHLTGLYNRHKLDEILEHQFKLSQRYHTIFGVIMLDIDFFKPVNDTYGHQVGDTILCEFANLLKKSSRKTDIIGRWGGEEFFIILENIDENNLLMLAEKLRATMDTHEFPTIKHKTASFGVTTYHSGDKINNIVARADKALYEAKESGRNCVKFL